MAGSNRPLRIYEVGAMRFVFSNYRISNLFLCMVYLTILIIIAVFLLVGRILLKKTQAGAGETAARASTLFGEHQKILNDKVSFYRALDEKERKIFHQEIEEFLQKVKIYGVDTVITEEDKVLVAASAVIPLFAFHDWFYHNLVTVDLYSDTFNHDFETSGANRRILGMVGGGVMNGRVALSKKALHLGFSNETDKRNTAIHEFVHLIDQADGAIDGVPDILLDKHIVLPWLEYIREKIEEIRKGDSDIDPYGGTSETEFFAVAAEYFFERPQLFEQKHPEMYALMAKIFKREPEVIAQDKSTPGRNEPCPCGSGEKYKNCHGAR